jgi:hypothetical protein
MKYYPRICLERLRKVSDVSKSKDGTPQYGKKRFCED